jgi:hypothetical protein
MKPSVSAVAAVAAVAVTALVFGTTGAVAGSLITGKQIKDNTITSKDIKDKTIAVQDLSPKTTKALQPKSTFAPWGTIPSGKTVTGRFYEYDRAGAVTTTVAENANFPAKAPAAPLAYGFGPDDLAFTDDDPACTGTYEAPKAAPGHVCVYMGGVININGAGVFGWDDAQQNPYTFYMSFDQEASDSNYQFWGNWAYTAP